MIAKSPCDGLLPVTAGGVTLSEADVGAITSVMPLAGQEAAVSAALQADVGVGLPGPGQSLSAGEARMIWTGRGQAFVLGPVPGALPGAAVTDQSDAWAVLRLKGAGARAVLARLCPLDLRDSVFPEGATARSLIGHMTASVTRVGAEAFLVLVFRSMARTAVHEFTVAMKSVVAQAELSG